MRWGVEHATVRYGSQTSLDDVTLGVAPATVNVIVGGDGAGKSTLLRALVGLVPLSGGRAYRPSKKEMGYVPATGGLYTDLTVDENLEFAGGAYGLTGRELQARSSDLLDRIDLARARDRLGSQLSGGMRRKLAVAMALLHRPALMVLDEPTTGIDPVSRSELWRLITGAASEGTGVALATTYVEEAHRGSTVVLLERGRAIATGSPADIIAGVPGAVGVARSEARPRGRSWRWGRSWRVWSPSGGLPEGVEPVEPTFSDAVMVAALANEREDGSRGPSR